MMHIRNLSVRSVHIKAGHYHPTSETPWRFRCLACVPTVAKYCTVTAWAGCGDAVLISEISTISSELTELLISEVSSARLR